MKRHRKQPVSAEVLAFWRARYSFLRRQLIETPAAQDAWFWGIQCDIINYLLHRYGGDEIRTPPNWPGSSDPSELPKGLGPSLLEVRPSDSFSAHAGTGKVPRSSGNIRPLLQSIAQVNEERYELLGRLRDEMNKFLRIERNQVREIINRWEQSDDSGIPIAELSPKVAALTDDEIVKIVLGTLAMDELRKDVADQREGRGPGG